LVLLPILTLLLQKLFFWILISFVIVQLFLLLLFFSPSNGNWNAAVLVYIFLDIATSQFVGVACEVYFESDWAMITAKEFIMNRRIFYVWHQKLTNHKVIESPAVIISSCFILGGPEAILLLAWVEISEGVNKAQRQHLREPSLFSVCVACKPKS